MRFLVDESTGPAVARWLRDQGHDVYSVYEQARGIDDDEVIRKASKEHRILITNDKDFGEKVYKEQRTHEGIILMRLDDERVPNKIDTLRRLLEDYPNRLEKNFVVVTEKRVRFART